MAAIKTSPLVFLSVGLACATGAYLIGSKIAALPLHYGQSLADPREDPRGVYQFDRQVGAMEGAEVDEAKGVVYFQAIRETAKFNTAADFRYNGYVLHISSVEASSEMAVEGKEERRLTSVYCLIVDRVKE
ncbi:hypothetical protein ACNHKD_06430 [Methylocystis sp. JAN1]|uniref:hypothetical protein n=1 Tax=Methylocystis sp. JAN1 TaxID=3397211 RepID=UPI003FA1FFB6